MKKLLASTKFQLGFTLIELVITVAIIVILLAAGSVSYSTAQRNSRNAQRKSDLKKIQLALEQFYADNHAYPDEEGNGLPPGDPADRMSCHLDGNWYPAHPSLGAGDSFTCNSNTYMSKIPGDPSTGNTYYYEVNEKVPDGPSPAWCDNPTLPDPANHGNCRKYTLWAHLENPSAQDLATQSDQQCADARLADGGFLTSHWNYCIHN